MTDPKKNCKIDDCPFVIPSGRKDCPFIIPSGPKEQEETEIKTVDLCNDPGCSNTHAKKLVDLSQGLSQLENILKNMTGLCKDPKCPSKSPSIQQKIDESVVPLPIPTRYTVEQTQPQKDELAPKPKGDIMDYKTCKGAVCYNAYMGYKIEAEIKEKEPQICGSYTCVPKPQIPKPCCASPTCPFNRKKDITFADGGMPSYPRTSLPPEPPRPSNPMGGPCGGFTCSSPKPDKSPASNLFDFSTTFGQMASPIASGYPKPATTNPCTFDTCPLGKQQEPESQVPVGLCGRSSCPYASLEYAQRLEGLRPNTPVNYNFNGNGGKAPCGDASSPFGAQSTAQAPCGNMSCPYAAPQKTGPPQVGLCGRSSCPFAAITPNVKARTNAPCGNPNCNFGETSYDPVGLCGQAECPLMSKTSPGAVKPCPFADKIKRYPCGSPSCPYVNPSGMLHTHQYTNDRSFVQEAARPYSGSASPYDYMSSLQPTYPTAYTSNYPLFSYTEPAPLPPCPFLPKKINKSCGKSTCPYADGKRPKDNFCVESTCPFGEGTCGGPRRYSCDSPNVEHCESPDCQVPMKKNGNGGKGKCCCCGGSLPDDSDEGVCCGGKPPKEKKKEKKRKATCCRMQEIEEEVCDVPKQFSCENPSVDPCQGDDCKVPPRDDDDCGRPDCRRSKKRKPSNATTKSLISGMTIEEECEGEMSEYEKKPDAGKCTSKTCPYLKKLVFCDDCGGVLPDEDTPESTVSTLVDTAEGTAGSMEGEIERSKSDIVRRISLKKGLEVVPSPMKGPKAITESKEEDEKPPVKEISLYAYPGVQIGHQDCSYRRRMIPRNMGWLWNIVPSFGNPELWRGYKPGAICKTVYKMMKEHRKQLGLIDPGRKKKKKRTLEDLKHCIEVKKKEGEYSIVVNPVKDPKTRDPMDNPYMDVTPIQFKVEKEVKEKEPVYCPCDEVSDQPSVHSSEFEFHFTPPAAIPETILRKKKVLVEAVAQYDCMDLPPDMRASCKSMGKGKGGKGGKGKGKKGKKK